MTDTTLLTPMTALAQRVGGLLRDQPDRAAAPSLPGLLAAFTALDEPLSALLREELTALVPGSAWAAELETRLPSDGEVWVADAVDGAVQYLQGLPQWCVSITLVRDRVPVAAVVHAPLLGETYAAAAGHGATRDGVPIASSAKSDPAAALVATSQPPFVRTQPEATARSGHALSALLPVVGAVRNLGATSWQIADTAAGRLDAYWEYGVDDGNLLAGSLIAREAGAVVTDVTGAPWTPGADSFLAAGPGLHAALLGPLRSAYRERVA